MSTLQGHIVTQQINAKIKIHLRTHLIWKKTTNDRFGVIKSMNKHNCFGQGHKLKSR
jgi:hypothetical protein